MYKVIYVSLLLFLASLVYADTPTFTITNTPIIASTRTFTATPTRTVTRGTLATKTFTPTYTITRTLTNTPTITPTRTITSTRTPLPTPDTTPHYVFNGAAVVFNDTVQITSSTGDLYIPNEYNAILQGMATLREGPTAAAEAGLAIDAKTITITVRTSLGEYVRCDLAPCSVDLTLYKRKSDYPW